MAFGAKDVSVSKLAGLFTFFLFILGSFFSKAWAVQENSPMHWSGDRTIWDRKLNRVELFGHAAVHQTGETLTADYIVLDLENRTLDAKGNAVYIASSATIHGEEMHFNLDTRTGSIIRGRVSNDRFTLTGERINKLGEGRFQTHRGNYTTCRDCPQSWSLLGADVDMEVEGYAFLKDVTAKIRDAPIVWFPYLVVPLKTRRQTGLLFPRFGANTFGFIFVQPFFWAINRNSDMTIGAGVFGGRGRRFEWEGRYALGPRSTGRANYYYLNDKKLEEYLGSKGIQGGRSRWALDIAQVQELPFGVDQKLRILEVSDNLYPSSVGDIPGANEAYLGSSLSFSHTTNQVSTFASARRYRNLISTDPDPRIFDPNTVQVFPQAVMTTNDKFLYGGPVAAGLTLGITNFSRTAGSFDRDQTFEPGRIFDVSEPPRLGIDPIREATRASVTPSLYTTLRPWDVISIVPSAQYRHYFYSFHGVAPNLSRGYLLLQTDVTTQLERIFETDDPKTPRVKHLIRPLLNYSLIPYQIQDSNHPFVRQMQYAQENNFTGYNFDNEDIVPITSTKTNSNYFVPQGNALAYGFSTQVIRRRSEVGSTMPTYQRSVEVRAGQSFNFRELRQNPEDRQPLSRFFTNAIFKYDKWDALADYFYIPYQPVVQNTSRHIYSLSGNYFFERAVRQQVLHFQRSVNFGYAYNRSSTNSQTQAVQAGFVFSLNDYIMPSFSAAYDLISSRWQVLNSVLTFQSPSQCWKFDINFSQQINPNVTRDNEMYIHNIGFNLSLNLTGSGFGGISEAANQVNPGLM